MDEKVLRTKVAEALLLGFKPSASATVEFRELMAPAMGLRGLIQDLETKVRVAIEDEGRRHGEGEGEWTKADHDNICRAVGCLNQAVSELGRAAFYAGTHPATDAATE